MGAKESPIENYLIRTIAKERNGLCWKLVSGIRGVPDRIVILNRQIVFVELKAPDEVPTRLQTIRHRMLRAHGLRIYILDTFEGIDALVAELEAVVHPPSQ